MKAVKESGYDTAVGPCRFYLQMLGLWPDPVMDAHIFTHVRAIIIFSMMFFFTTGTQTTKLVEAWGDLKTVADVLTACIAPTTTCLIKVITIWYHRKTLQRLMLQMTNDWQDPNREYREIIEMNWSANCSWKISTTCIMLSIIAFVFQLAAFLQKLVNFKKIADSFNDTQIWPMYIQANFPYDSQNTPYYEISVICQILTTFFSVIVYPSSDSLFIILVLHLCGQLTILKLIVVDLKEYESENFCSKIAFIQKRHEWLFRFALNIEEIFNKTFLFQIVSSTCMLCFLGYQLIMTSKGSGLSFANLMFTVYYCLCILFITFMYCYMAEQLREKSTDLSNAVYNCDWVNISYQQSKLLNIISIRARCPFEITAGKLVSFSLSLYCSILKTSGSYISILVAMQKRLED